MSARQANGRSLFDQPVFGFPYARRVIMSCDASKGPLLTRYFLIHTPLFALYLHHLHTSDEDRALHDHPWSFVTFLLSSGYYEWTPGAADRGPRFVAVTGKDGWWHVEDTARSNESGRWLVRHYHPGVPAEVFARSNAKDLNNSHNSWRTPSPKRTWRRRFSILWRPAEWQHRLELVKPTWTLVLRLRRRRDWGFITKHGWMDWRAYGKEWCD